MTWVPEFDQGLDLRIAAHLQHFAVLHGQGLNLWLVTVGGENLAVEQHQISRRHGFQRGKTHGRHQ
jgi:hypothetical protein